MALSLTDEQLTNIDSALATPEQALTGLVALDADQRRSLTHRAACPGSAASARWARGARSPGGALPYRPGWPGHSGPARPRLQCLHTLAERADDTETALGSNVMLLALGRDALLKVAGGHQGLDALRKALSGRFNKTCATDPVPAQD